MEPQPGGPVNEGPTTDEEEITAGSSSKQVQESRRAAPSQVQVVANVEMTEEVSFIDPAKIDSPNLSGNATPLQDKPVITKMERAGTASELTELASLHQNCSPPSEVTAPSLDLDPQATNNIADPQ